MQSMVQPEHADKNESSHAVPIGDGPFVTAGEHNLARPANGCMYCFHAAAAACGLRLDCELESGSLNLGKGVQWMEADNMQHDTRHSRKKVRRTSRNRSVGVCYPVTCVIRGRAPEHGRKLAIARKSARDYGVPVIRPGNSICRIVIC